MEQIKIDVLRFADLLSKYTGISKSKIDVYLQHNSIENIFSHPTSICSNHTQLKRIEELREMRNIYNRIKLGETNKAYELNSTSKAGEYFKTYFEGIKDKEHFACAFLDAQNNVISTKVICSGTINESPVYEREIVKEALMHDTCGIIAAHNHPGGSRSPSKADIITTQKLATALKTVGINLIDHIIIAGDRYYSFAENGVDISVSSSTFGSVREKVQEQYKDEYPAIKHISEKTAKTIDELNNSRGSSLSISEIKEMYNDAGKKIEGNYNKADMDNFKMLKDVVDDLKQAQLKEKQEAAQQKSLEKGLDLDLIR
ncbi:MAG TPA: JAB domain-containing protein [Sedimentibacter sp.]|nr:JAB domain-containing protein [Sedimentibacter sp.]